MISSIAVPRSRAAVAIMSRKAACIHVDEQVLVAVRAQHPHPSLWGIAGKCFKIGKIVQSDRLEYLSQKWNERRPDLDITPWRIWGRITRLHELFLAAIAPALGRHELNFKEFQTLAALVLGGEPYEAKPNTIGRFNLLTSGGVANLLARMEREGLIERRPDQQDGRSVIVRATERGLADFEAAVAEENRIEHELLQALTEEERIILATLLRKLLIAIDSVGIV